MRPIKPGQKFIDNTLEMYQPHERVVIVTAVHEDSAVLDHVTTQRERTVPLDHFTQEAVKPVTEFIDLDANANALVGERVRLHLRDGGQATGRVTAVHNTQVEVTRKGKATTYNQLHEVVLDRSSSTTYPLHEVERITVLD